jgi:predicted Zn-dependent protease
MANGYYPNNSGFRILPILLALVAAGFIFVRGCQEGPFGRPQVVGLTPQQEATLGLQSFQQVLAQERGNVLPADDAASEAVTEVGRRLASASVNPDFLRSIKLPPQKFDWEFRVVRSRQVNAFCLPGGKVVVYTGILPVCHDYDGLATVMGHEIGHALAHHGAERIAQQQLVNIGQMAAAASIRDLDPQQRIRLMALLGAGAQFGILLPYSRSHESEADHIGLLLMSTAGYDPRSAIGFWQRMEKTGGSQRAEFTSTHPSHQTRIRDIQGWLPQALALYQRSSPQDGTQRLPEAP